MRLCTPFIYVELDIFPLTAVLDISATFSRYPEHVRYLRIGVTRCYAAASRKVEYYRLISEALRVCQHTTSLAVYLEEEGEDEDQIPPPTYDLFMSQLGGEASALIMRGSVSPLGVYSVEVECNGEGWSAPLIGINILLQSILPFLNNRSAIRRLVLATDCITPEVYDGIQLTAAPVRSITFTSSPARYEAIEVWTPGRAAKWSHHTNLTHLRLMNCGNTPAHHIPELVRHFTSLKFLLVAEFSYDEEEIPPRRTVWDQEANALWKQRPPFEAFHIERILEREIVIVAMGTIPSKTLIAASLYSGDLEGAFITDPDLFPYLDLLRIEGKRTEDGRGLGQDPWQRKLSEERGILIQEEAEYLINRRWR